MPPKNTSKQSSTSKRVNLRDIAAALDVSHATVSRALRNNPKISKAMRERIHCKAREMGYEPDPMLSALAKYRLANQAKPVQASLAWLNTWSRPELMRQNHEFDLYWKGAAATAKRFGFNLEEFALSEIPLPRLEHIFKSRNIRGVLIAPHHDPLLAGATADLRDFAWDDFAVVRCGRTVAYPSVHFVTSAQTFNAMQAFEEMSQRGYRRIGYVGFHRRMRIFVSGLTMVQLQVPNTRRLQPLLLAAEEAYQKKLDQLSRWIKQERPDAILTDMPDLSEMLKELGVAVPEAVALATMTVHDTPIDAGIDQHPEEIGRAAVRMLVALLTEQNFGIPETCNEILIQGRWVDGKTLPARECLAAR